MTVRHVVAKTGELRDGQIKEIEVEDGSILLIRDGDEYYAISAECPHHGGPLAEGSCCDGRIRCPWHQSVFNIRTGRREQPPSLDSVASFRVEVVGENIVACLPRKTPKSLEVPRPSASGESSPELRAQAEKYYRGSGRTSSGADKQFLIIGTGAAGNMAAQTLRSEGFAGQITMLTREEHLPYDRTELSKRYLAKPDQNAPILKDGRFYDENEIEILYGHDVIRVNPEQKEVACSNGMRHRYDELLIATGSRPRKLGVDGEDLEGVVTLRTLDDAKHLRSCADGAENAVVIGASFIAMETAASLRQRDISVTVVAPESVPFAAAMGEPIGRMLQKIHQEKGTSFCLGHKVDHFEGSDGKLESVVLDSGRSLPADLVIVGVGVDLATEFLGQEIREQDGAIRVNRHLQHETGIWAAGDIARVSEPRTTKPFRIEHWRLAEQLGVLAARNMLGAEATLEDVPFFWTKQFSQIVSMIGFVDTWERLEVEGSPSEGDGLVYYSQNGALRAVASVGRDQSLCRLADIWREIDEPISAEQMQRLLKQKAQSLKV
ncbi:MAG: FAD-dependent oxidoreductase [Phycisphaerae bacterium]